MNAKKHSRARNAALLLAVVPALAGCKLLGLDNGFAANASLHERLPADFGAEQLAMGRKALTDGDTMTAIESFQLAKLYPDHAAAAANGLAVAYSRLGRTDLTERYFQFAISLSPEDERYRSNLAKFYANNPVPPTANPGAELAALQATSAIPMDAPVDIAIGQPAGPAMVQASGIAQVDTGSRMRRVSRNEVLISGEAGAEQAVRPARSRQAVIEIGTRTPRTPVIRVGVQTATSARPAYPVRMELAPR